MTREQRKAQRRSDWIESNVQMGSGFILGAIVTYFMFDLSPIETIGVNSVYFVVSYIRQIVVRSMFRARERRILRDL